MIECPATPSKSRHWCSSPPKESSCFLHSHCSPPSICFHAPPLLMSYKLCPSYLKYLQPKEGILDFFRSGDILHLYNKKPWDRISLTGCFWHACLSAVSHHMKSGLKICGLDFRFLGFGTQVKGLEPKGPGSLTESGQEERSRGPPR